MSKRKTIRHYHEPGHLHELTFSCFHQQQLLSNDGWCQRLSCCLDSAGEEFEVELVAFVFMPDHVHLLINPISHNPDLSLYLARIKQPFSKQIRDILADENPHLLRQLTVQERPGKFCFRFWQEGPGYDRNIFDPDTVLNAINYLHMNPVRRNLCQLPNEWKWSSARYYGLQPHCQQFEELPRIFGIPPGLL